MTLENFLDNTNKFTIPELPEGTASSVGEIVAKLIIPTLPKRETVLKWHDLLIRYCEKEDAIFFIRRYASASGKNWDLIRRGFLTEYESGLKYVFCDNFLAHYFYLMALKDHVPTLEEFRNVMLKRNFPYGYQKTSAEAPFQAFPHGKVVNINKAGWKLAHLYSVNQDDYSFNYKNECKDLFPRGAQPDWKFNPDKGYVTRELKGPHSEELRAKTVAHFLRLVHPINYFLVPMVKFSNKNIGELPEVIGKMKTVAEDLYGDVLLEFQRMIFARSVSYKKGSDNLFFKYGRSYLKRPSNPKTTSVLKDRKKISVIPKQIVNKELALEMIKAYIKDGMSFRTIETKVLGIESPPRGGGFQAMKILNNYGITGKDKGSLKERSIEEVSLLAKKIFNQARAFF